MDPAHRAYPRGVILGGWVCFPCGDHDPPARTFVSLREPACPFCGHMLRSGLAPRRRARPIDGAQDGSEQGLLFGEDAT